MSSDPGGDGGTSCSSPKVAGRGGFWAGRTGELSPAPGGLSSRRTGWEFDLGLLRMAAGLERYIIISREDNRT